MKRVLEDTKKKVQLKILGVFLLPLLILPIEIYVFKNSNSDVAMVSAMYILMTSASYLLSEKIGAKRHWIGIGTLVFLYGLYGVHSMYVLQVFSAIVLFCIFIGAVIMTVAIVGEERKTKMRHAFLHTVYPLEKKTLTSKEKEVLSSLYGKNGHYYKVIQSGKIEKEEAKAINAKIRRELKKP